MYMSRVDHGRHLVSCTWGRVSGWVGEPFMSVAGSFLYVTLSCSLIFLGVRGLADPCARARCWPMNRGKQPSASTPLINASHAQMQQYSPLEEDSSRSLEAGTDQLVPVKESGDNKSLLTPLKIVALCSTWFALGVWIYSYIVLEIPSLPLFSAGKDSCPKAGSKAGGTLGSLYAWGALVSMFVAPTAGLVSDKTKTKWGRRYPFVLGGFVGVTATVWGIHYGNETVLFVTFAVIQMFFSIAASAYNGLVADVVPDTQRGVVSGALGSATAFGNLFGAGLNLLFGGAGAVPIGDVAYTIMIHALLFACLAFAMVVLPEEGNWVLTPDGLPEPLLSLDTVDDNDTEAPDRRPRRSSSPLQINTPDNTSPLVVVEDRCARVCTGLQAFLKPLKDKDFLLVVLTRFLVQMGIYTVQEFLLWYISCTIQLPTGEKPALALNLVLSPLIGLSIISATISGYLSDYFGGRRKIIVYGSTCVMFTICMLFAFVHDWNVSPWLGAIFGLGYGALLSIDYALALDAAPSKDEAAKDLGIWNLALVMPLTVAAPVGGYLLDHFNTYYQNTWIKPCLAGSGSSCNGYVVLFVLSGTYFACASLAVFFTSEKIK